MPSPPAPSHPESDPEGTAELPQLDPAAEAAAREQRQSQTDTWVAPLPARLAEALAPAAPPAEAPPPAGAAPARQAQLTEPALSAKLHETQDLLASRSARVTPLARSALRSSNTGSGRRRIVAAPRASSTSCTASGRGH